MSLFVSLLLFLGAGGALAQELSLDSLEGISLHGVEGSPVVYQARPALRVSEPAAQRSPAEDKLAIIAGSDLRDGVIEVHLAGQPADGAIGGARGFVGIAFHIASDVSSFECFYLRPTNGRADDQLRRNHSSQYISFPDFPWHRLRKETPGKYEAYVDLVPGAWTKVRIEIEGTSARLFVRGNEQPTLIVNDLKLGERAGAVGLWIGPGTQAHFSRLSVSKTSRP